VRFKVILVGTADEHPHAGFLIPADQIGDFRHGTCEAIVRARNGEHSTLRRGRSFITCEQQADDTGSLDRLVISLFGFAMAAQCLELVCDRLGTPADIAGVPVRIGNTSYQVADASCRLQAPSTVACVTASSVLQRQMAGNSR
jgi:hypothetical protein